MAKDVYVAGVGLTKVDLTGNNFSTVFDLFAEAYRRALQDSPVRAFDAIQIGIMDSEEFENRANIATKMADVLGLRGIPAVRSETASSTGAAAFHEAYYKVASGHFDSVLVLAGERMKTVTTEVATAIMSKTVAPVERRFGFTMPALIALVTQAWCRERRLKPKAVSEILARLMCRAHTFGSENPLAAFHGKPEPIEAYFDPERNRPVATPLMRKDCSPICDGAAAVILTSKPQAVRVAGLGSATETSSMLDRENLSGLDATRRAADIAYWRAGLRDPRALEGLVVECHDAFNSLLPVNLGDLRLIEPDAAAEALVGSLKVPFGDPYQHPITGVDGSLPTNLSGGLKARGHPVGGTGLFQIAENYLQIVERFPNPAAQVRDARIGLSHSIGGPGNNVYVTLLERSDNPRAREEPPKPRLHYASPDRRPGFGESAHANDVAATIEAFTTIHVTSGDTVGPIHVALVKLGDQRVFAKLDHAPEEGETPEALLHGQRVRLLVKDDGDQYFQIPRGRSLGIGGLVERVRRRVVGAGEGDGSAS